MKTKKGFSLIEILVVLTIFSIVAVLSFRAVFLTLRGARKSDATVKVRETLDYAIGTIERHLRNANSVLPCPLTVPTSIIYLDSSGKTGSFSCLMVAGETYVASGSARLTSEKVNLSTCSFACEVSANGPSAVTINLTGVDLNTSGAEGAKVTISTKIFLRNY